jgi:hypothetical protein
MSDPPASNRSSVAELDGADRRDFDRDLNLAHGDARYATGCVVGLVLGRAIAPGGDAR